MTDKERKIINIILSLLVAGCFTVQAQEQTSAQAKAKAYEQDTYFTMDEMPALIVCLPPPPHPFRGAFRGWLYSDLRLFTILIASAWFYEYLLPVYNV